MLYWENSHILGVYFTRLCFKLNNLLRQKFGMSELKLSWPVTLTGNHPAFNLRPALCALPYKAHGHAFGLLSFQLKCSSNIDSIHYLGLTNSFDQVPRNIHTLPSIIVNVLLNSLNAPITFVVCATSQS
jgi:hypothetical protein